MSKISDRIDRTRAIAQYHHFKKKDLKKISDHTLSFEVATGIFKEKIKDISKTFEKIDKKSFSSKRRYTNCFENMFEKLFKIGTHVVSATAYFFRYLPGVIHPSITLKNRITKP